MNKFIILIFVILLPLLHGCGMFGTAEPEATEEQASVTEAPSTPTPEEPIQSAEEIETLKDEEHRQEIESKEEKIEQLLAEQDSSTNTEKEEPSQEDPDTEDESLEETEEVEDTEQTTEAAQEEPSESNSLLGLIFGSDEDEVQTEGNDDSEESPATSEEEESETPSTWSKVQGFFEVSASEDVPVQEEPSTSPVTTSLSDSDDICERAPSMIAEMRQQLEEMESLPDPRLRDSRNDELFPTIYFDFDQSLIKSDFKEQLQNQTPCVLEELEKNDDLIVQVEGHADERGNDEYNIALGHRRANSVLGLVKVYVTDPSRIQTISYGEEFPLVQESNREAWSKNRRVVFTLLLKSQ